MPQQAGGFLIKCFLLIHCQKIDVQSYFIVAKHVFRIGFSLWKTLDTQLNLDWDSADNKKLCTLHLPSKLDTSSFPVTMAKPHKRKCQNYSCMTTSPLTMVWWNVTDWSWTFNKKIYGLWLLWEIFKNYIKQNIIMTVLRKKIHINLTFLTFADWQKRGYSRKNPSSGWVGSGVEDILFWRKSLKF